MKDNNFSARLNLSLDKEGFPPKNRGRIQLLAELVGLTHRGASKWVNGESSPPAKKYPVLAKKLKVNEHWLRTGEGSMEDGVKQDIEKSRQSSLINVPVYCVDSFLSQNKKVLKIVQCALSVSGDFFGLLLDSEAMSPRFPQGSTIIFDKAQPKDGDFVLVHFDEFPNPIFRQLFIIGETYYLNAHNPKFDRLILSDHQRILGRLVQAILTFN